MPRWIAPERVASAIACNAHRPAVPRGAAPAAAHRAHGPADLRARAVRGRRVRPARVWVGSDFYIPGTDIAPFGVGTETAAEGLTSLPRTTSLSPEVPPSVGAVVGTGATEGGAVTPTPAGGGSPPAFSQPNTPQTGATGPLTTPQPVPEPGTLALAAVALVIVWAAGLVGRDENRAHRVRDACILAIVERCCRRCRRWMPW